MKRILFFLSGFLRMRNILVDDRKYLERYYVAKIFGWSIYLHRFLAMDRQRGMHDHPWKFAVSLILTGGYYEERLVGWGTNPWDSPEGSGPAHPRVRVCKRSPGRINIIREGDFHAERGLINGECWTLFIHSPRSTNWGFLEIDKTGLGETILSIKRGTSPPVGKWYPKGRHAQHPLDVPVF